MESTYTTKQGDTWDIIAKNIYGNELYADFLLKNNIQLVDTVVFSVGVTVTTPELTTSDENLPDWRK